MARTYADICDFARHQHEDSTWDPNTCAWFFRTKDPNGPLSNMASGMPIDVIGRTRQHAPLRVE